MVGKIIKTIGLHDRFKTGARWSAGGVLVLGLVACLALSMDADAQGSSKQPAPPELKGVSDVVRAINGNSNAGMVVVFSLDGTIEPYFVRANPNQTITNDPPPANRTTLGEMTNVDVEIYQYNPSCVTWIQNGIPKTVCR